MEESLALDGKMPRRVDSGKGRGMDELAGQEKSANRADSHLQALCPLSPRPERRSSHPTRAIMLPRVPPPVRPPT